MSMFYLVKTQGLCRHAQTSNRVCGQLLKAKGYDLKDLIERVAGVTGITSYEIIRSGRRRKTSCARSALLLGDRTSQCEAAGAGLVIEYDSISGEYGSRTRSDIGRRAEIEF